jgi:hypothetical protein
MVFCVVIIELKTLVSDLLIILGYKAENRYLFTEGDKHGHTDRRRQVYAFIT